MVKRKSGRLTNGHASPRTQSPGRRFGLSNGFQRQGGMKNLRQLERIEVFHSTGRADEPDRAARLSGCTLFILHPSWREDTC